MRRPRFDSTSCYCVIQDSFLPSLCPAVNNLNFIFRLVSLMGIKWSLKTKRLFGFLFSFIFLESSVKSLLVFQYPKLAWIHNSIPEPINNKGVAGMRLPKLVKNNQP